MTVIGPEVQVPPGTQMIVHKQVKITAMGTKEKDKIEKLMNSRASELRGYIDTIKSFVEESNEHYPSEHQKELDDLRNERAQSNLQREQIGANKMAEEEALSQIIEEEANTEILALKEQIRNLEAKKDRELRAGKLTLNKKYEKKEGSIVKKLSELDSREAEIRRLDESRKMIRKLVLGNSFNQLRESINQALTQVVERLWTQTHLPEQATDLMRGLPSVAEFRQRVSPEFLFSVFNKSLEAQKELGEIKCAKCESTSLRFQGDRQTYCTKCGAYGTVERSILETVALPSLDEIMGQVFEDREKRLAAAVPAETVKTEVVVESLGPSTPSTESIEPSGDVIDAAPATEIV